MSTPDHDLDARLRALAERQHSVFTRQQARDLGASRYQLRNRLLSPDFEELSSSVVRLVGAPTSFHQEAMAGVLDAGPGALLSHEAVARLWGVPGFDRARPTVVRSRGGTRRASKLAVVHEVRNLLPHHGAVVDGIPATTGARMIADLAGAIHPLRLRRAYANARARRITTGPRVEAVARELCGKGWPGTLVLRELLAEPWPDDGRPETGLELRFVDLCDLAGIERPACQVDVGGDTPVGRVDFTWRRVRGLAEVDSDLFHRQAPDREADARRDALLLAAGWRRVERFDEHEVWHDANNVVRRLQAMWAFLLRAS